MKNQLVGDWNLELLDRGRGPVLLLVHGFPLDHSMWQPQIEEFARDHRVIAPDLRGFGGSRRRADADDAADGGVWRMEDFADDLAGLLDALDVREPITFCGLSMGGYIAWQFWRRHRERVGRLILCDTRAAADAPEAAATRRATAVRVVAEGVGFLADSMNERLFARETRERSPQLVEATRRVMLATAPASVAAALRGMAERPDSTDLLSQIDVPTLVVCGRHDAISTAAEMRGIAAAIPGAKCVEVPDAGHMAPLENPAVVNAAMREFLSTAS